jgi:hypothetical protein
LPAVKTALLFVAMLAALLVAGCGSSGSSSEPTTDSASTTTAVPPAVQTSYLQRFQAVNDRFQQSPQIGDLSQALSTVTGGSESSSSESLAAAEAPLQSYLHRLDTYITELHGLRFPACARQFQQQIVRFESEGRESVAKILPLLRTGDVARVSAYVGRAAPVLSKKLGQVEEKESALTNGGNDGC